MIPVEPATLQLAAGTKAAAVVRLAIPLDAASESELGIILTAAGETHSSTNYAKKEVTIRR